MAEPVSLAEAKLQLRVTDSREDALISGNVVAAREWVERETGLILVRRAVTERISRFGAKISLLAWPVAPGSVSVTYDDRSGIERTIADATIRSGTRPANLIAATGSAWPSDVGSAVAVTFTAGFAAANEVPVALKQAMLIMITAFYEARDGEAFDRAERAARSLCRGSKRNVL